MKKNRLLIILILALTSLNSCKNKEETISSFSSKDDISSSIVEETYLGLENDSLNEDKIIRDKTFDVDETINTNSAITLKTYISDGMVLQQKVVNVIKGSCLDNNISIKFNDDFYYGTVTNNIFEVYLPCMEASTKNKMKIYSNTSMIEVNDIDIGEVFLLSGQSNARYTIKECEDTYKKELTNKDDDLRILTVKENRSNELKDDIEETYWTKAKLVNINNMSTVAYLTGKKLRESLDVPVGIIVAAVDGVYACYFMDNDSYSKLDNVLEDTSNPIYTHSLGYNGMINPLLDIRFRSVIFYQGESNAYPNHNYYEELKAIINGWRKNFNYTLPFVIVGLHRFNGLDYSIIRKAQQQVVDELDNCYLSINIDNGNYVRVHPIDKTILCNRIATTIEGYLFNKDKPIYPKVKEITKVNENKITISFDSDIVLKNNINGFEYSSDNLTYNEFASYEFNNKILTLESNETINYIRYGFKYIFDDDSITKDVTKQISVYNLYDYPLDQFEAKI